MTSSILPPWPSCAAQTRRAAASAAPAGAAARANGICLRAGRSASRPRAADAAIAGGRSPRMRALRPTAGGGGGTGGPQAAGEHNACVRCGRLSGCAPPEPSPIRRDSACAPRRRARGMQRRRHRAAHPEKPRAGPCMIPLFPRSGGAHRPRPPPADFIHSRPEPHRPRPLPRAPQILV